MDCDLQGLGVLVTRPAAQADALCELIERHHGRPVRFAALQIVPASDTQRARTSLAWASEADVLVFVSVNAVQYAYPLLPDSLPAHISIAAVGRATLPQGTHNAQPYRDGVLFNDTHADHVRFASRDAEKDRAFKVPVFPAKQLTGVGLDASNVARPSFGRGLCVSNESIIAAGCKYDGKTNLLRTSMDHLADRFSINSQRHLHRETSAHE